VVLKKKIKKVQNSLDNTVEDGCRVMKIVHMVLENKLICESSTEDICHLPILTNYWNRDGSPPFLTTIKISVSSVYVCDYKINSLTLVPLNLLGFYKNK
jgi:hypothetical protein